MNIGNDVHVESAGLQKEIESYLNLKGSSLIFDYRKAGDNNIELDLITVNPRHDQSFLFRKEIGRDKIETLRKMLNYVKTHHEKDNSYTIQWTVSGDTEFHTSYFRASDMYDALDKLYYGRDVNTIKVFSVVLNPVA